MTAAEYRRNQGRLRGLDMEAARCLEQLGRDDLSPLARRAFAVQLCAVRNLIGDLVGAMLVDQPLFA